MSIQQILQTILNSFQSIALYSLATFGIVLVFKTSIATNFSQGIVATFGAYVSTSFSLFMGYPLWISIIIGMVAAFILGAGIDVLIIRRGKYVTPSSKQIITMGLLLIFTNLLPVMFGVITTTNPSTPKFSLDNLDFNLFGIELYLPIQSLIVFVIALLVLGTMFLALKYSKWGLGVRATASNEIVAQMMGVNTRLITAISWGISAALATIAAASLGTILGPGMMGKIQVYGFLSIVLGGVTTFFAPIFGAILIPIVINFAAAFSSVWADAIVFSFVLIVILIFPNGIFGKKYVKKV
jgi:branched-chain amino acid transport system permease protein